MLSYFCIAAAESASVPVPEAEANGLDQPSSEWALAPIRLAGGETETVKLLN